MQKHEVRTWLSICGISLRGYADGLVKFPRRAVKAASEEAQSRNSRKEMLSDPHDRPLSRSTKGIQKCKAHHKRSRELRQLRITLSNDTDI